MTDARNVLQSLLDDEVTQAVLRADRLPLASFEATLRAAAQRLPAFSRPAISSPRKRGGWQPHPPTYLSRPDQLCCGA